MTHGYDIRRIATRLHELTTALAALASERQTLESDWQRRRLALSEQGVAAVAQARAAVAAIDAATLISGLVGPAERERQRRLEVLAAIAVRMRRQVREGLERRLVEVRAEAARRALQRQRGASDAEVLSRVAELHRRAQQLQAEVVRLVGVAGVQLPEAGAAEAPGLSSGTALGEAVAGLTQQLDRLQGVVAALGGGWAMRTCTGLGRLGWHVVVVVPAIVTYLVAPGRMMLPVAIGLAVMGLVAAWLIIAWRRGQIIERLAFVRDALADLDRRLDAIAAVAKARIGTASLDRLDAVLQATGLSEEHEQAAHAAAERALARIRDRETRLRQRLERAGAASVAAARRQAEGAAAAAVATAQQGLATAESQAAAAIAAADHDWSQGRARIIAAATALVDALDAELGAAERQRITEHPVWSDASWSSWQPPAAWRAAMPLGAATGRLHDVCEASLAIGLPDRNLTMPVALDVIGTASLLLRTTPTMRGAAIDALNQLLLRSLTASPSARLRLTLIDPIGLGQSFSPLLALADHGDVVLDGGVATDSERIDRALDDLCAHVEAVVRTRLRGRYDTIADYNREAGELQEPVRLVAVADFPAGFGERATERLGALLKSGARCGVHVLVHQDVRQRLQPGLESALVQHVALELRERDGALQIAEPPLPGWRLDLAPLPPPALAGQLAAAAGAAAVQANRVELSFSSVVPASDAVWSLSTATSLRVPIGMCGVGKVQYLELGRGTAQHVLIGGRTGSGKSTLLHVLVTSAALWHHPRELDLYLIDFKKGVEFQAYAAVRLPHARVVAVESDREFGLSVLRRLDTELVRRGELFRAAGVQDLAAHRRSGGEHVPRILLLIDEFQEFFTEDDTVARDAALLLDRFVRQGRAFGLHVVLGSQTLSGNYSLAKSSLGQMGVRIVLPCNEADGHLLLHEDNDAMRLLTRPGEAVYNDQAGLAEGNSPFQVCWLPDGERSDRLRPLATATGTWKPAAPMVVFAGDAPARFDEDLSLAELLARPLAPADRRTAAWVGQSSSLRGAAEVAFPAASGGNLLLVGQHREAAQAIIAGLAITLAARHAAHEVRMLALDGEEEGGPFAQLWTALGQALPQPMQLWGGREVTACFDAVMPILERRVAGEDPSRTPVVLVVNALQRLRAVRPDDDAPFDRSGAEPPAERLAKLLAQGPELGIHAAVWCDGLAGMQRSLSRRSQRDFDLRILFQMSMADSSELIDDAAASRLGLHSALLAVLGEGRREKFRPWQVPDVAFLARIQAALAVR